MLGWGIDVFLTDELTSPKKWQQSAQFWDDTCVASWESGLGGLEWIEHLVKLKLAEDLGGSGYPCRYRVKASHVLPIISAGTPTGTNPLVIGDDYIMPENWSDDMRINEKILSRCKPDDWLLIEAMDQS